MNTTMMIPHTFNQVSIAQRKTDGYVNATAACKANGKQFNDYSRLDSTQEFLQELSSVMRIPVTEKSVTGNPVTETEVPLSALLYMKNGGVPSLQGTWVHPQVAIHLAQWLSPKFAVLVSQWVYDWMMTGKPPVHEPIAREALPPVSAGQMVIEKDRMIDLLTKTVDHQEKMITLLETEVDRLKTEPETRKRITPDEEDQIVTMKAQGYSTREIAEALDRNIDTIRTVLYRHKQQ